MTVAAIEPIDRTRDAAQCAELMTTSEPWLTLRVDRDIAMTQLCDPAKEVYVIRDARGVVGFAVVDMRGLVRGYVKTLCVRADCRSQGVGSALLDFCEARIFSESPNVFICASSFNDGARRLYERRGFELVGTLRDFAVSGSDEMLLRKSRGSWEEFRRGARRAS